MKVFLGGTCNGSAWRLELVEHLDKYGIGYFDPVVKSWDEAAQKREDCDYCLYCITPPMTGVYSIAEAVDDSNKRPEKTILVVLKQDSGSAFTEGQRRSLESVKRLVTRNGGTVLSDLISVANYLRERM